MAKHLLNINHASAYELEAALHSREQAQLIVNKRELLGDFKSWDDVRENVPGMTDKVVQSLRDEGLTVGSEAPDERKRRD